MGGGLSVFLFGVGCLGGGGLEVEDGSAVID